MNHDGLNPLAGNVLVELECSFRGGEWNGIAIPKRYQGRPMHSGRIVKAHQGPWTARRTGITDEELEGRRVLLRAGHGQQVEGNLYRYPTRIPTGKLTRNKRPVYDLTILALITEQAQVETIEELRRCRYCGPAGRSDTPSMMLARRQRDAAAGDTTEEWYCPRCGRAAE